MTVPAPAPASIPAPQRKKRLYLIHTGGLPIIPEAPAGVGEEASLGRGPDNDIVLRDARTSKYHARIFRDGDHYRIQDLGSLNGTQVNGVTTGSDGAVLDEGDVVQIGAFELRVVFRRRPPRSGLHRAAARPAGPEAVPPTDVIEPASAGSNSSENPENPESPESPESPVEPARPESIRELLARMGPFAAEHIRRRCAADDVAEGLRAYARHYLAEPIEAIREQNGDLRRELEKSHGSLGGEGDVPRALVDELIELGAAIEGLRRPEADDPESVGPESYDVLRNVPFLSHGDILPSHLSRLDDPESFSFRELLVVHKVATDLTPLLRRSRALGVLHHGEIAAGDHAVAARAIFGACMELYSDERAGEQFGGAMMTLGYYSREGGSCRHRSATLQAMLQEAGVRSRYVRGLLVGAGVHAWCEVQAETNESVLVCDPNFGVYGEPGSVRLLNMDDGGHKVTFRLKDGVALGRTMPEHMSYVMEDNDFNTVWRPVRRSLA